MNGSQSVAAFALTLGLTFATSVIAVDDSWFDKLSSEDLVGKSVFSGTGEAIAEIDGLVIDPLSRDIYAVLSVGSPPGPDAREVVVPMSELRPGASERLVLRRGGREALESQPAYIEDESRYAPLLGPQSLAEVPR